MKLIDQLKKQITVVSNPWYRENLGGYRLYFVGLGERKIASAGWWKTRLDFYTMGMADVTLRTRVGGSGEYRRTSREFVLYGPGVPYEEYYEEGQFFNNAWIVFRAVPPHDPLKELIQPHGYRVYHEPANTVRNLIFEAANIGSSKLGERLLAQAAFLRILSHLFLSKGGASPTEITLSHLKSKKGSFRDKVLHILTRDIASDFSVGQMAGRLSISRSSFSHKFSREFGESFVHLKTRVKIQHAQELLKDPGKPVKQVAFEIGLSDPAYFTNLFRKYTGVTPGSYRKFLG